MGLFHSKCCMRAGLKSLLCALALVAGLTERGNAQGVGLTINLAPLDGVPITPNNILSFGLQSGLPAATEALVKGNLRYRQSGLSMAYTFRTTIRPGVNRIDMGSVHPQWSFSDNTLRELFLDYHFLPQGTYEYCVTISLVGSNGEVQQGGEVLECLYQKAEDVFLINLLEPENNAKIYEQYPMFSWIVNYPFASQLTYRIRVAEIKEGQNTVNAVNRNNPVYTESNLPQTTTTYPVYGTPLKTVQPYGWTVDAHYKGILLGGAEPWKFTVIEDSLLANLPRETYYVDIRQEQDGVPLYVVGQLKIKYVVQDLPQETLSIIVTARGGKPIGKAVKDQVAKFGDNRMDIDLSEQGLKHGGRYQVMLKSNTGVEYSMPIIYVNPDFVK